MDGHNPFKDNFMQKSLLTKQEAFLFIYYKKKLII
nr:MAG TPA: hypothetical protein [Bacteriophage sp.]